MIGWLEGQVIAKGPSWLLLNAGGVGYQVHVPQRLAESAIVDSHQSVFTHLAVREDALTLYGFVDQQEKDLFELLIDISGIGPKIGLAILSTYSPQQVQTAIIQQNAAAFSAVSGIGKKNAERIVLELKNKHWTSELSTAGSVDSNLQQALVALGYSAAEAVIMAQEVDAALPLQEQIKAALQRK